MAALLIDGKKIAAEITDELAVEVQRLQPAGITPGLAAVLVGDNPASEIYVNSKARACRSIGIHSEVQRLPKETTTAELLAVIDVLNQKPDIDGILIQSPLPPQIDSRKIYVAVDPAKDVDGFHPQNLGEMLLGYSPFLPCTPLGVVELLVRSGHSAEGKHVVILGRSNIVGKPLAALLLQKRSGCNATVTVVHTHTRNPLEQTRRADILVAAMGNPEYVRGEMLREGCVVVDVGVNRVADPSQPKGYRVAGDVHFPSASEVAAAITPVPGGVGPMTIAMLLSNTVQAAKQRRGKGL